MRWLAEWVKEMRREMWKKVVRSVVPGLMGDEWNSSRSGTGLAWLEWRRDVGRVAEGSCPNPSSLYNHPTSADWRVLKQLGEEGVGVHKWGCFPF